MQGASRPLLPKEAPCAHDGEHESPAFVSPEIRVTNRPPKVVSRPGPSPAEGGFRYAVVAEDPDGDAPLRVELDGAPGGMQIGSHSGEIRWRPGADQSGAHRVRVVVDDLRGGRVVHAFDVEVAGEDGNKATWQVEAGWPASLIDVGRSLRTAGMTLPLKMSAEWAYRPDMEMPRLECDPQIARRFLDEP